MCLRICKQEDIIQTEAYKISLENQDNAITRGDSMENITTLTDLTIIQ